LIEVAPLYLAEHGSSVAGARRVSEFVAGAWVSLSEAGVRKRQPGIDERELRLRVASLRLPRETMIRAFGWDPDAAGP
jgi:hypothetical protein